jgi:di/tricarboxylate transporter
MDKRGRVYLMPESVLICVVTIIIVILLGYFTKSNIGLWAIAASYILGVLVLDLNPRDIVTLWPIKIFMMLFSVTFFYGYSVLNGSLEKLSLKIVYASRRIPWLIAITLFFISILISGIGAGDGATVMLIPIAISIAKVTRMHYLLASVSVVSGISIGGFSPVSTIGIFIRELADQVGGYGTDAVNAFGNMAMLQAALLFCIVFILSYFFLKGYRVKAPSIERPEPYTPEQIKTLVVIGIFVLALLAPPLLKALFPHVTFFTRLNDNIYLTFIAFMASILCRLLNLGDEKRVFARVPWHALTTICGMGMLIAVAGKSGIIEIMSLYLSESSLSGRLVQVLLSVFAGVMSLFVSGFVVNTTFFALVPGLATGLSFYPGLFFSAIAVGSIATSVSPFSGSGGLVIASVDDETQRTRIFNSLLIWPFINLLIYIGIILIGI